MSEYYCGKCKNKYAAKQNWAQHFSSQRILITSESKGSKLKVPNICYNTPSSERVCEKSLQKAVDTYKNLQKDRDAAKRLFSGISSSVSGEKSRTQADCSET